MILANNKDIIACTSLFNLLLGYFVVLAIDYSCLYRYFKETKMLTITQPGDLFQFEQEPYDSFH